VASEVRLTRRFQKSFERFDRKIQKRVKEAVGELRENPHKGKHLKGELAGEWSLRVGEYRILYIVEKDIVWVETVRHRKEVYR